MIKSIDAPIPMEIYQNLLIFIIGDQPIRLRNRPYFYMENVGVNNLHQTLNSKKQGDE